ncbi:cytochrome c maturation protein CcmE [Escherichia coli]
MRCARDPSSSIRRGELPTASVVTQQMPEVGERLRVGGMVMPGSAQRYSNSLKVTFTDLRR